SGYLQALEQVVFVLVARIRSLETKGTSIDLEHVRDDLRQIRFVDARPLVDAIAGMKADPLGRNAAERRIGRFDVNLRPPPLLLVVKPRLDKDVRQERSVHLQDNAAAGK